MTLPSISKIGNLLVLIVLIGIAAVSLFAKGPTKKITIEGPSLARPIEITDPNVTRDFQVFGGLGTSNRESNGLIADWASGAVAPPSGLETYRVSFYLDEYPIPYVVLYAFDPSTSQGYVYIPGKADEWYRTNISIIIRHVEGTWFRTRMRWEQVARPLISKQLTVNLRK